MKLARRLLVVPDQRSEPAQDRHHSSISPKAVAAAAQKYELGSITAFEVLDSQTRLATAESALLNVYVGYQEAYVNYQRATAVLLDGLGMVLEMPKAR